MEWNDDQIRTLKRLWSEGYSAGEIAMVLGCSRSAVIGKVHRLGLPARSVATRRKNPTVKTQKKSKPAPKPQPKAAAKPKPEPKPATKLSGLRPRQPTPLPVVMEHPANPPLKGIHDLGLKDCRYPIGEPEKSGFGFCGKPVEYGQVYCGEHCRQAYPNHKPMIELARAA